MFLLQPKSPLTCVYDTSPDVNVCFMYRLKGVCLITPVPFTRQVQSSVSTLFERNFFVFKCNKFFKWVQSSKA